VRFSDKKRDQQRMAAGRKRSFTGAWSTAAMTRHSLGILVLAAALALAPAANAGENTPAPAKKLTASRAFLTLDPFMVSIMENYKVRGFLVLEVTLNMPDRDGQEGATIMRPKLRDAFVRALMEYGAKIATVKRVPDLTGITARLQEQTDGVLGAGKARVLLTQALVRPL
jgi:hypothetical protein